MKQTILLLVGVACGGGLLSAEDASNHEASSTISWLKSVAAELRELRREVLADRIERQEARVQTLEHELDQARATLRTGEEVQRSQDQEMIQLNQRLSDPALPADERSQLESVRAEATVASQIDRTAYLQGEAQIVEKLRKERNRLDSLRAAARTLSAAATPQN